MKILRLTARVGIVASLALATGCLTPKVKFGYNPLSGSWEVMSAKEDDVQVQGLKAGWGGGGDPNLSGGKGGYVHADSVIVSSKAVPVIDANTRLNAQYGMNADLVLARLEGILGTAGIQALLYGGANRLQRLPPSSVVPFIPPDNVSVEEQTKRVDDAMSLIETVFRDPAISLDEKESKALSICSQTPGCPIEYVKRVIAQMRAIVDETPTAPTTQPP